MRRAFHAFHACPTRPRLRLRIGVHASTPTPTPTAPKPAPHRQQTTRALQLRPYQEECIQTVLDHLGRGHKRVGISLATGSGKTVIFTHLIGRVVARAGAGRTLILAHRRELVLQAAQHCRATYPWCSVEVEMGKVHASGAADITVASVMSITSKDRMGKFDPARFKLVLVDEAHHIVANSYMDTLRHFGLVPPTPASPALVAVSATFSRFDGLRLGAAVDHIVYHQDYVDMIEEGWLSPPIFTTVKSHVNLAKVRVGQAGDFQPGALSRAVNTADTNELTVRSWLARARDRRSTLVFCADLAHVDGLTSTFRKHGIDARNITSDTPRVLRSDRLDSFKSGDFPVLLNCGVFTEGTDVPNIDCVLLARPTKSRNLLIQMIGRGMRLHAGKENCHVIDMVASLEAGIVTVPTLFGLDPSELLTEADVGSMKAIRERHAAQPELPAELRKPATLSSFVGRSSGSLTFTDYDSVYDLIDDTSGERHIRFHSLNAWVQVNADRYVLTNKADRYLTIEKTEAAEPDGGAYRIVLNSRVPAAHVPDGSWRPPQRSRAIGLAPDLAAAVRAADTFAADSFPRYLVHAGEPWRRGPATAGQLDFLNKLRGRADPLLPHHVTKGKAADMITKVKHGAKTRLDRIWAAKRRVERGQEKVAAEVRARAREVVRVGPLER